MNMRRAESAGESHSHRRNKVVWEVQHELHLHVYTGVYGGVSNCIKLLDLAFSSLSVFL